MAERKLTIRMNADTKNLQAGMATASASTQSFGKSIQSGIVRHAAGIRMTGIAIAGIGVAVTAMVALSVKAAMSFEKELANVSTMLDDVSMKYMPEFADGIREMSKEFGESTDTLNKGLYDILSASIAPSKALDVLAVSAKAATAGLTDTGVAADAITTVINSYGMAAEDAGKVSDILFAIIKRGKTTFAELGPAIGKVAATASIAGVSFEELGATIATVTRAGIRTDEAMTSVNGVIRAFLKPTDDAAKAAREFGFELNTNTLRTIGLQGVMELLSEATAEQLAQMFPNIRGLKAIAAAMKDAAGFAKDYKLMLNAAGLTEEAFKKQTETAAFAFDQLKQQFTDILRVIGAQFIPIIKTEFLPMLLKVIDHAKVWVERFKALSPEMKKFLMVLGPILIALGGLIALLPTLAPIIAILLGPVGLIVAAIAGLSAAFLYFWTTSAKFRATIKNIGEGFRVVFVNIWNYTNWFKKNFVALWITIAMGIGQIMENLRYNIWEIIKAIGVRIIGWSGWLYKNWLNAWKNLFSAIGTAAKNFGTNIWEYMKWIGEKMKPKNWFKKIEKPEWKPLFESFEAVWEELPEFAEVQLKSLVENVKNYMEPLPELVKPVWAAIEEGAKGAEDAVDELLTATEKYITTFDKLQKIRKKEIELTEDQKKRLKELEEAQKKAEEEIAKIRATSFEEWQKQNEARTKELYDELAKQKQIQKDAKDEIAKIRTTSFEDWQVQNEARTKELYAESAKQNQIQKDAKDEIADIRTMSFEEWQKNNEARTKELYAELATQKQIEKDAKDEIINIQNMSFKDWQKQNEARSKELEAELKKSKDLQKRSAKEIAKIRILSFEDWQKQNEARTKELYDELATQKRIEQNAKNEIINIRKMSFEEWQKQNEDRTKELYTELATQKQLEQDAKNEISKIRTLSFEEWKENNEARTEELYKELATQEQIEQDAKDEIARIRTMSFEEWKEQNEEKTRKAYEELEKQRSIWYHFEQAIGAMWERMGEAAKEYFSKLENWLGNVLNAFAEVIKGTKSFGDALLDLAYSIPIIGGIAEAIVSVVTAIWDWATGAAAAKQAMADMLEDIAEQTEELSEAFKDVGVSLTGSIKDAERAIKSLIQTQEDLELNTRDKLIKELDKYYDYRVLKVMDLNQLLKLSAETREKLETGSLEEIAESAEETAEREKDAKVGTLQAIEDAYAKESELIDKKIKLLEIEIKLLMAAAEAEQGNLEEAERLRSEAMVSLNQLIYTREELNQKVREARDGIVDWGIAGKRSTRDVREGVDNARIGIELWGEEISKIPKKIDFDIIGNLHIPKIPKIGDQSFSIKGIYAEPYIPGYQGGIPYIPRTQVAVLHPKEAVLTAPQAEEWRAGGGGGSGVTVNIPRGAVIVYGDIRTKADVDELEERIIGRMGERVAQEALKTVPL